MPRKGRKVQTSSHSPISGFCPGSYLCPSPSCTPKGWSWAGSWVPWHLAKSDRVSLRLLHTIGPSSSKLTVWSNRGLRAYFSRSAQARKHRCAASWEIILEGPGNQAWGDDNQRSSVLLGLGLTSYICDLVKRTLELNRVDAFTYQSINLFVYSSVIYSFAHSKDSFRESAMRLALLFTRRMATWHPKEFSYNFPKGVHAPQSVLNS